MFARIVWSQRTAPGPMELDKGLTFFRERIIPSLQSQKGYLGAVVLANTETGEAASVTYWESAGALVASEAMGAAGRLEAAKTGGITATDVDRFEMLLQDRVAPVKAGTFVRINDVPASRARIDAVFEWARDTALPKVKALSGYRALLIGANRATGRMLISSVWESAADRQASEAGISGMRGQLRDIAQAQAEIRVSLYEGVLAEVSQAAQQLTTAKAPSV
jgi:heme-degrading monooxygenase HmoA